MFSSFAHLPLPTVADPDVFETVSSQSLVFSVLDAGEHDHMHVSNDVRVQTNTTNYECYGNEDTNGGVDKDRLLNQNNNNTTADCPRMLLSGSSSNNNMVLKCSSPPPMMMAPIPSSSSVYNLHSPMPTSPLYYGGQGHCKSSNRKDRRPPSSSFKVNKPRSLNHPKTADTPYRLPLADCILDMRLCSSPAPSVVSTATITGIISDPHQTDTTTRLPSFVCEKDAIRRITPDTLVDLLDGKYDDQFVKTLIIDCRYPYEYAGGHIPGAVNVNTPDAIERLLLMDRPALDCSTEHHLNSSMVPESSLLTCIIFHCEFSSQRAPRMALHVRNFDRLLNSDRYPHLFYPEIYVLDGGYKAFWERHGVHDFILYVDTYTNTHTLK